MLVCVYFAKLVVFTCLRLLVVIRYAEELRLREFEARMEGELGSPSCTTLDATAVRARR